MNTCKICGREYEYSRKAGHTKETCNSCLVNKRRDTIKKKALEYKGNACIRCGYDEFPSGLSFHHINPEEKSFNISGSHCRRWQVIQEELDKCVVLCMNCHNALHSDLWDIKDILWD
jgi:hypothetical protein